MSFRSCRLPVLAPQRDFTAAITSAGGGRRRAIAGRAHHPHSAVAATGFKHSFAETSRLHSTHTDQRFPPPTRHDDSDRTDTKRDSTVVNALTQRDTTVTMASDSDYASFLDKANQDPSAGVAKSSSTKGQEFRATESGVQVPTVLKKAVVDAYYVSDGDEPFEVVGLKVEGGKLPDEGVYYSFLVAVLYVLCNLCITLWILREGADGV